MRINYSLEVFGYIVEARRIHEAGIFEYPVRAIPRIQTTRVYHQNGLLAHDPYTFLPTFWRARSILIWQGSAL